MDDFHNARAVRYQHGRSSPVGYWRHAFDYELFRRWVLVPLGPGGSGIYRRRGHDLPTDRLVLAEPEEAPTNCVVIIDGVFLHRQELVDAWQFSVFLRVPFEESVGRMAERDGSPSDPAHPALRRYVNAQRLYFAECSPERRASIVIDNTNLSHPFDVAP